jgi:hypothetical protein
MEMNLAYFEATLNHLKKSKFSVETVDDFHQKNNELIFERKKALCRLGDECAFDFEALQYRNGRLDFYLQILKIGRVKSFSFPLDSWKYHANRIEFKYRDDPQTGLGLALTIDLTDCDKSSS